MSEESGTRSSEPPEPPPRSTEAIVAVYDLPSPRLVDTAYAVPLSSATTARAQAGADATPSDADPTPRVPRQKPPPPRPPKPFRLIPTPGESATEPTTATAYAEADLPPPPPPDDRDEPPALPPKLPPKRPPRTTKPAKDAAPKPKPAPRAPKPAPLPAARPPKPLPQPAPPPPSAHVEEDSHLYEAIDETAPLRSKPAGGRPAADRGTIYEQIDEAEVTSAGPASSAKRPMRPPPPPAARRPTVGSSTPISKLVEKSAPIPQPQQAPRPPAPLPSTPGLKPPNCIWSFPGVVRSSLESQQLSSFRRSIKELRAMFPFDHPDNPAFLFASRISSSSKKLGHQMTLQIQASSDPNESGVMDFTCSTALTLPTLIDKVSKTGEGFKDFILKPLELAEYLDALRDEDARLDDFSFIHAAARRDVPIRLQLLPRKTVPALYRRTRGDDALDANSMVAYVAFPRSSVDFLSLQTDVAVLFERYLQEAKNFLSNLPDSAQKGVHTVVGTAKFLVSRLLGLQTGRLKQSLDVLVANTSTITLHARIPAAVQAVTEALEAIMRVVERSLDASLFKYSTPADPAALGSSACRASSSLTEATLQTRPSSLHNIPTEWAYRYRAFKLGLQVHCGSEPVSGLQFTDIAYPVSTSWFGSLHFETPWYLVVPKLSVLPLEARLRVFVYGQTTDASSAWAVIASSILPLFGHDMFLISRQVLVNLWPGMEFSPTFLCADRILDKNLPFLLMEFKSIEQPVKFMIQEPDAPATPAPAVDVKHSATATPALRPRSSAPRTSLEIPNAYTVHIATHAFEPQHEDELRIEPGQEVVVIERPEGGWWHGKIGETAGWFPSNYVDTIGRPLHRSRSVCSRARTSSHAPQHPAADAYVATHTFAARFMDELSFEEGQEIKVLQCPEGGWFEGVVVSTGQAGWFPSSYVHKKAPPPRELSDSVSTSSVTPSLVSDSSTDTLSATEVTDPASVFCVGRFRYDARYEDELSFDVGARIDVLNALEGGWWEGSSATQARGWFPVSHVEIHSKVPAKRVSKRQSTAFEVCALSDAERSASNAPPAVCTALAKYAYKAQFADELSFGRGQLVTILQQPSGGWWEGSLSEGSDVTVGWFPCNYVEIQRGRTGATSADPQEEEEQTAPNEFEKIAASIIQRDLLTSLSNSDRKFMWMYKMRLVSNPSALVKVLESVPPTRPIKQTLRLWSLARSWAHLSPLQAIALLQPHFSDPQIRALAVDWIDKLPDNELLDYLFPLVEALKFEPFFNSSLAKFLLRRALQCPRVMHYLFWHLLVNTDCAPYQDRFQHMLDSLVGICGEYTRQQFQSQLIFMDVLAELAREVKQLPHNDRKGHLRNRLSALVGSLRFPFRLPLNPAFEVDSLDIAACGVFNSNAAPIKLVFSATNSALPLRVLYKAGDDLRQDLFAIQIIQIMDRLWRQEGLDLQMTTFLCQPTSMEAGFIELVQAETLREVQTKIGVSGSFNDRMIYEYLKIANPQVEALAQVTKNFMLSCAGYCVATYVLGAGDRHNDNIMVTKQGHLFHIDFGKLLGHAQMFGSIKRDRVPFVLTSDMAYVINGGDAQTTRFQEFIDLCCRAFEILRKQSDALLSYVSLLVHSGLPSIQSRGDLTYIRDALRLDLSAEQAMAAFTQMVEASLSSLSTKFNFFIHNLAQLKSSSSTDHLFTFSPDGFSVETDGKVASAKVIDFERREDVEQKKFYTYVIQVQREDGLVSLVFRRYSEFHELFEYLSAMDIPRMPAFPNKIYVGRSHTRQVTEKRAKLLDTFLQEVLALPPAVSESQVFYTFLHSTERDFHDEYARTGDAQNLRKESVRKAENSSAQPQALRIALPDEDEFLSADEMPPPASLSTVPTSAVQFEASKRLSMSVGSEKRLSGAFLFGVEPPAPTEPRVCQICMKFKFEGNCLTLFVSHVRGLSALPGLALEPYVKCYLLADPLKVTKRRTSTKHGTVNPTFNEVLEWKNMSRNDVLSRTLQLTVNHDRKTDKNVAVAELKLVLRADVLATTELCWYNLDVLV
eukprot:m.154919 g.154919  ORF g.154919 m.154919 type:complete len:2024 (+) comp52902_c0_seq1:25-6096(+)